jgi:hypothetical protein
MVYQYGIVKGTIAKLHRAWLLTWEWAGNHIELNDKFVAVISSRYTDNSVKKILEQYYVSKYLSFHEQFAFAKSSKHLPYKIQNTVIEISEQLQEKTSLPSRIPFAESMIIGGNPWLWARIVYELETWINEDGVEYLKWRERENISWDDGEIKSDFKECILKR